MARTVDYLPVAIETGSNVQGQSSYDIDPIRMVGHQAGVAKSSVANKMWRQSSMMVSALANMVSEALDVDLLDDGDMAALIDKLRQVLMGGRIGILGHDTNFYVSASGSDSAANDGLTISTAWATLQHAFDMVLEKYDINGYAAVINVGAGTNFAPLSVYATPVGSGGSYGLQIKGAGATATRINAPTANAIFLNNGTDLVVYDLGVTATLHADPTVFSGMGFWTVNSSSLIFDRVQFQACADHMHAAQGSSIITTALPSGSGSHSYTIAGGARRHMIAAYGGSVISLYTTNVTVAGTPAFSSQTLWSTYGGTIWINDDTTFSGSATGSRFAVDRVSLIYIGPRPETIIPGSIAGFVSAEADSNYFVGTRVP